MRLLVFSGTLSLSLALAGSPCSAQCAQPAGQATLAVLGEARLGRSLELALTGRANAPFVVTVDTSRGPLVFPWGTVCQSSGLVALFAGSLPGGAFRGSLRLPVSPSVAGVTLFFQGLVQDSTAPNQFVAISNAEAKTILAASPWTWGNGPSSAETFFPIGVWLQTPSSAQRYRNDMGINTFVGLWTGPSEPNLSTLAQAGMPVYADQTAGALQSPNVQVLQAWTHEDEPDNAQPNPNGPGYLPCVATTEIQRLYQQWKAADPTRPVYLNFGKGVAQTNWIGRGTCTNQTWMYPEYIKGADIVCFDIYPATSSDPQIAGRLEYVALGLENLQRWVAQSNSGPKIIMNVIGTTNINSTTTSTTPEQIKSCVWMSLVHGSMGILYFVHEFQPAFRENGIYNHPANVAAVRDTNALITSLAPVLNSPTVSGLVSVSSSGRIARMVKSKDGVIYVLAVEMLGARNITADFTVAGVANATVRDLEEGGRPVPFAAGRFTDTFAGEGYDAHVYEITPR